MINSLPSLSSHHDRGNYIGMAISMLDSGNEGELFSSDIIHFGIRIINAISGATGVPAEIYLKRIRDLFNKNHHHARSSNAIADSVAFDVAACLSFIAWGKGLAVCLVRDEFSPDTWKPACIPDYASYAHVERIEGLGGVLMGRAFTKLARQFCVTCRCVNCALSLPAT